MNGQYKQTSISDENHLEVIHHRTPSYALFHGTKNMQTAVTDMAATIFLLY